MNHKQYTTERKKRKYLSYEERVKIIDDNRRVHYVFLTKVGRRIADIVRKAMIKVEEQVLEN